MTLRLHRFILALLVVGAALVALHASAHNSWVVSDRTRLSAPGVVRLAFVTGHDAFPVGESATQPARVALWEVMHRGERSPVTGYAIAGNDLAARFELTEPGLHIAAAALYPRFIEFEGEKFNSYLNTEHASHAIRRRELSGTIDAPGYEYYTKLGKAFVQVGEVDPSDTSYLDPVGHALEIIPLSNPIGWRSGDTVRVRVLANGKPAAGLHISSGNESSKAHEYEQTVVTDADGEAEFTLEQPGHWYLRTLTIEEMFQNELIAELPAGEELQDADWESFWATMTVYVLR